MNRILVLFITLCLSVLSYGQNAETLREARAGNAAAQYRMANCYKFGWDGAEKMMKNMSIGWKKPQMVVTLKLRMI